MRTALVSILVLALSASICVLLYQILSRDYRYFQLVRVGDQLLAQELPFQATQAYGTAVEMRPDNAIGYVKRAQAHREQGNLAPALTDLETAWTLSRDKRMVSFRMAEICYEMERFDDAARHYRDVLSLDPSAPNVLYKLGLAYFRAGREAEAIEALNEAAALQEHFWQAYYLRGAVLRSIGAEDEAETDFLQALSLRPEAFEARSALIELYLDAGAPLRALPLIRDEMDRNPQTAEVYLQLAEVHRQRGKPAKAIEAVNLALEQDPNLPEAYLRAGELWLDEASRTGDPIALDKAVSALESVAQMDPSSGPAALSLERAYLALGDDERVFAELQRAREATPVPAEAHRLLGDLYRARDNYAEAITAYHVYLKLEGDVPAVLERLGDTYLGMSKPKEAAATYVQLSELEPHRVTPLVKAARAHLAAGDPQGAARICRRGLATNPENPALQSLLARSRGLSSQR